MKKILTLMMVVLLVALSVMPVMADNYTDDNWQGGTTGVVEGNADFSIDKYYVFPHDTQEVPENTVTYELSVPGTEGAVLIEGDEDHPTVYNGILSYNDGTDTTKIQVMGKDYDGTGDDAPTMEFSEALDNGVRKTGDDTTDTANCVEDEKDFVKKPITIDFSKVTYTEPGIYRYWLKEESSNGLVTDDIERVGAEDIKWRTIDVYVVDDQTDGSHKLSVSEVVYEGKLGEDDKPKAEATKTWTADKFDVTQQKSAYDLAGTSWVYTVYDTTDPTKVLETYTYEYDENDGGWTESHYKAPTGPTTINRNRTTHLNNALGTTGPSTTIATYADAKAHPVKPEDIVAKTWVYTNDTTGETKTYTWDPDAAKWKVTPETELYVTAPDADAKVKGADQSPASSNDGIQDQNTPDAYHDWTYEEAKDTHNYVDSELQKYVWSKMDGANKITWTWDSTEGMWKKQVVYDPATQVIDDEPEDEATPTGGLTVDYVKYSVAEAAEKVAQEAASDAADATNNPNGAEPTGAKKTDHYKNEYEAFNLTIKKEVIGNQGSRDKYFMFKVVLKKAGKGVDITPDCNTGGKALGAIPSGKDGSDKPNDATKYTYADIVTNGNAKTYITSTDDNETVTILVYLNAGDEIVLEGVKKGAEYEIYEIDGDREGYVTSAVVESGDTLNGDKTSTTNVEYEAGTSTDDDHSIMADSSLQEGTTIKYTNKRSGVIPTGVLMSITGGVVLIAIAGAGLLALNKKRDDEE